MHGNRRSAGRGFKTRDEDQHQQQGEQQLHQGSEQQQSVSERDREQEEAKLKQANDNNNSNAASNRRGSEAPAGRISLRRAFARASKSSDIDKEGAKSAKAKGKEKVVFENSSKDSGIAAKETFLQALARSIPNVSEGGEGRAFWDFKKSEAAAPSSSHPSKSVTFDPKTTKALHTLSPPPPVSGPQGTSRSSRSSLSLPEKPAAIDDDDNNNNNNNNNNNKEEGSLKSRFNLRPRDVIRSSTRKAVPEAGIEKEAKQSNFQGGWVPADTLPEPATREKHTKELPETRSFSAYEGHKIRNINTATAGNSNRQFDQRLEAVKQTLLRNKTASGLVEPDTSKRAASSSSKPEPSPSPFENHTNLRKRPRESESGSRRLGDLSGSPFDRDHFFFPIRSSAQPSSFSALAAGGPQPLSSSKGVSGPKNSGALVGSSIHQQAAGDRSKRARTEPPNLSTPSSFARTPGTAGRFPLRRFHRNMDGSDDLGRNSGEEEEKPPSGSGPNDSGPSGAGPGSSSNNPSMPSSSRFGLMGGFQARFEAQNFLQRISAGLDEILPMMGFSSSRIKVLTQRLRAAEDDFEKVDILTELCEVLSVGTEESVTSVSLESLVPLVVQCLNPPSSPDMMLLAARVLTHMLEVLPASASVIAQSGAVQPLCASLLAIEYIDLAEQSLSALEKLSRDYPGRVLDADGFAAALSFFDFFPTAVQRVAASLVCNLCRNCPNAAFEKVSVMLPNFWSLMKSEDQRTRETAILAYSRLTDSFKSDSVILETLSGDKFDMMNMMVSIVVQAPDSKRVSHSALASTLNALTNFAKGSALLSSRVLSNQELLHALVGLLRRHSSSHDLHALYFADALLPDVPPSEDESIAARTRTRRRSSIGSSISTSSVMVDRRENLKNHNDAFKILGEQVVPELMHFYAGTESSHARRVVLSFFQKYMTFVPAELLLANDNYSDSAMDDGAIDYAVDTGSLNDASSDEGMEGIEKDDHIVMPMDDASQHVTVVGISGGNKILKCFIPFISSLLAKNSSLHGNFVGLSIADTLIQKMQQKVIKSLEREGVVEEIKRLQALDSSAKDEEHAGEDVNARIVQKARQLITTYFSREGDETNTYLENLKTLVVEIETCSQHEAEAKSLKELCDYILSKDGISNYEFVQSGLLDALYVFFSKASDEDQRRSKLDTFLEVLVSDGKYQQAFKILVRKLVEILSLQEKMKVVITGGNSNPHTLLHSGLRRLSQPLKLRLKISLDGLESDSFVQEISSNIIAIEPLANIQKLQEFLWNRVSTSVEESEKKKAVANAGRSSSDNEAGSSKAALNIAEDGDEGQTGVNKGSKKTSKSSSPRGKAGPSSASPRDHQVMKSKAGGRLGAKPKLERESSPPIPVLAPSHSRRTKGRRNKKSDKELEDSGDGIDHEELEFGDDGDEQGLDGEMLHDDALDEDEEEDSSNNEDEDDNDDDEDEEDDEHMEINIDLSQLGTSLPAVELDLDRAATLADVDPDGHATTTPEKRLSRTHKGWTGDDNGDEEKAGGSSGKSKRGSKGKAAKKAEEPDSLLRRQSYADVLNKTGQGGGGPSSESPNQKYGATPGSSRKKPYVGSDQLVFYINEFRLSRSFTILQAIMAASQASDSRIDFSSPFSVSRIWDEVHVLKCCKREKDDLERKGSKKDGDTKAESSSRLSLLSQSAPSPSLLRGDARSSKLASNPSKLASSASTSHLRSFTELPDINIPSSVDDVVGRLLVVLRCLFWMNENFATVARDKDFRARKDPSISACVAAPVIADSKLVPPNAFVSQKLSSKLALQLGDPLVLSAKMLPSWCVELVRDFAFLFPLDTRISFFQSTSLGLAQALHRLQSRMSLVQANSVGDPTTGGNNNRGNNDVRVSRIHRQKVRIHRDRLLDSAIRMMDLYAAHRTVLEVEYNGEVGTGLGPTLEFYALISQELQKVELDIWRTRETFEARDSAGSDSNFVIPIGGGLFPKPILIKSGKEDPTVKRKLDLFRFMGKLCGKALLDGRLLDLHFAPEFWNLVMLQASMTGYLGEGAHFKDLSRSYAARKLHDISRDEETLVSELARLEKIDPPLAGSLNQLLKLKEACQGISGDDPIGDLHMAFTLPGFDDYELVENGKDIAVTTANLVQYIRSLVICMTYNSVKRQASCFVNGFSEVLDIRALLFFMASELDVVLCGPSCEKWTLDYLIKATRCDHGYTHDSAAVQYLFQYMTSLQDENQRLFLKFITGSPCLPAGGLSSLQPRLTIVRRTADSGNSPDETLPTVMTCTNYLKLPDYSSYDCLKKQFDYAISEGQMSFHLS